MLSWGDFATRRPDLAAPGRQLLYQYGVGLGFLATVGRRGAPRVHPMCPLLTDTELFAFIVPSPKQDDLLRDGRYALHSFPCENNEDAFYLTGLAKVMPDPAVLAELGRQFVAERARSEISAPPPGDALFRFEIGSCLLTRTSGHGDSAPRHTVWRAEGSGG